MEIKHFSKSLFRNALICPWRADQIHNKRVRTKMGKPAMDGIEVHELRAEILSGKITFQAAVAKASNQQVIELLQKAIANDIYAKAGKRQIHESKISLNLEGKIAANKEDEAFLFIIDRIVKDIGGAGKKLILAEDLKTGAWEKDDPLERHGYVLGTMIAFPGYERYAFDYFFCASGNRLTFNYDQPYKDTILVRCEQDEEFIEELTCKDRHPLFDYMMTAYDFVAAMPCEPTPGEHCTSLYGEPCQFLTTTCPLNSVPAIIEAAPPPATVQAILDLPVDRRVGAAFLLMLSEDLPDEAVSPELKSLAWQGIAQLRNGATRVMKRIKDLTPDGEFVVVGDSRYGWRPIATVDVETALELMLSNDFGASELAKVVSLSRTGLERISKKQYPELREMLLEACVDESGGKEFGLIKD